jgi:pimeloyl-ACP methyl ester carboxylesterase
MMPIHPVEIRDPDGRPRGRLAVHTAGAGTPLLLLHAFPLDHSMWREQAALAEHVRLVVPDQRGFGASPGPGPESVAQLADDAVALLDALHVAEPAVVCGVSMGGYVAQHLAARHPDRVSALVLVDTKLEADTPEARAGRADLAAKVGRLGQSILADAMVPRLLAAAPHVQTTDRVGIEDLLRRTIVAQPVETIQAALAALGGRPDMTEAMRRVRVPTLLVVGAEDTITPPACMEAATRVLPDARLLVVPEAGHMTPLERPAVFNAALLEFLRKALAAVRRQTGHP